MYSRYLGYGLPVSEDETASRYRRVDASRYTLGDTQNFFEHIWVITVKRKRVLRWLLCSSIRYMVLGIWMEERVGSGSRNFWLCEKGQRCTPVNQWRKICTVLITGWKYIGSYIGLLEVIFAHFYKSAGGNCESFVSRTFWYELLSNLKRFIPSFFKSREERGRGSISGSSLGRKKKNSLLDDDLFSTYGATWTHLFFLLK